MSTLKYLSAIYIAAASAYAVTLVFAQHPDWAAATRTAGVASVRAAGHVTIALGDHVVKPGWRVLREETTSAIATIAEYAVPRHETPKLARAGKAPAAAPAVKPRPAAKPAPKPLPARVAVVPTPAPARPRADVPALRPQIEVPPARRVARAAEPAPITKPRTKVTIDIAPPPAAPTSADEVARVEQRLKNGLSTPLYKRFDLFLYVSKAAQGPVAQRMYVFAKAPAGGLTLRYDWPVSTGREKVEYNKRGRKLPSFTPAGYYELDPHRMYAHYRSYQWGTPMPHAMFFNWVHDGLQTGLAIHAAHGDDIALLGKRASGGCIHLSPKDAAVLFKLIRADYRGRVPRFAFDRKTKTMSNRGELMRTKSGRVLTYKGYKVLVFIENYGGGEDVVAALM